MPMCPSCKGIGKIIDPKFKATINCADCNGKGIISDNMLKFIKYYKHQKQVQKEISVLEKDPDFLEQYQQTVDD